VIKRLLARTSAATQGMALAKDQDLRALAREVAELRADVKRLLALLGDRPDGPPGPVSE
jgi:hypothetical protein